MKIVTKKNDKNIWIALKDKYGLYHYLIDDSHTDKIICLECIKKIKELQKYF